MSQLSLSSNLEFWIVNLRNIEFVLCKKIQNFILCQSVPRQVKRWIVSCLLKKLPFPSPCTNPYWIKAHFFLLPQTRGLETNWLCYAYFCEWVTWVLNRNRVHDIIRQSWYKSKIGTQSTMALKLPYFPGQVLQVL